MKIRTFKAWDWQHHLIYRVGFVLSFGAALLLINAADTGYSIVERLPALLGPCIWLGVGLRLKSLRERYASGIAFVTKQGVSVHVVDIGGKPLALPARGWVAHRQTEIEQRIAEVADFWSRQGASTLQMTTRFGPDAPFEARAAIDDYLNGTHIEIVVTDEPVVNRRHAMKAAGLAYPKRLVVSLQPGELTMGYPARFWNILEHETGHACLDALGVPQERHHVEMQAAGWWAA